MTNLHVEHHLISINGVTLNVATAGPEDGPPVVLLHGFPEFWYGWRDQIPALAAAGFRVIAPDQRGYNLSDKPKGIESYRLDQLVADITGLIRAFGYEKAHIVGHDWGAGVAWSLALKHAQVVDKLGIINVPHPKVFTETLRRNIRQMLRSTYAMFFQLPGLPEAVLRANNYALMTRSMKNSAKRDTFTEANFREYRKAWKQEGALAVMLNWYRAAVRHPPHYSTNWRLSMPVLIIWGAKDVALELSMAQQSIDLCDEGRLVIIENATHWVQHDAAERVNGLLVEFLGEK